MPLSAQRGAEARQGSSLGQSCGFRYTRLGGQRIVGPCLWLQTRTHPVAASMTYGCRLAWQRIIEMLRARTPHKWSQHECECRPPVDIESSATSARA